MPMQCKDPAIIIYFAAEILKHISQCNGIKTKPLNNTNISEESAESIVPESVYMFMKWLYGVSKRMMIHQ